MNYSTPKVTIDLEEYQELQAYKDFKLNSRNVNLTILPPERIVDINDVGLYGLTVSSSEYVSHVIAMIKFKDEKTRQNVLQNWEIKFIQKEKI
jgi:hypothetical protein